MDFSITKRDRNKEFADSIIARHRTDLPQYYYGASLVLLKKKNNTNNRILNQQIQQLTTNIFNRQINQYEKQYYQRVTALDNRKFIRTLEQIYDRPGDKNQLVYLFKKLGVVTKSQREWQDTTRNLKLYQEELVRLEKRVRHQEEWLHKLQKEEPQTISTKKLVREVMDSIQKEIRMERIRYGLD